ncbi:sensor histidine kinase [Candidatus Peregrinibacteria bacterium]|nr:sensor histidine kinase [Candidatus Peregrinibacteria bacterium]
MNPRDIDLSGTEIDESKEVDVFENSDFRRIVGALLGIKRSEDNIDVRLQMAELSNISVSSEVAQGIIKTADDILDIITNVSSHNSKPEEVVSMYKVVTSELDGDEKSFFIKEFNERLLKRMLELFSHTPTPDEIKSSNDPQALIDEYRKFFTPFSSYFHIILNLPLDSTSQEFIANMRHDFGNLLCDIPYLYEMYAKKDEYRPFVDGGYNDALVMRDILAANFSIITQDFPLKKFKPAECFLRSAIQMKARYSMNVSKRSDENFVPMEELNSEGTVLVDIDDGMEIVGNEYALSLVAYNLLKNSIRPAEKQKRKVNASIQIKEVSDGVVSIVVMDTGIGVSYDELRDHFTTSAQMKLESGNPLTLCEKLLLDDQWRTRVTPHLLHEQLLRRGESLSSGGTGIGLDIVRQIAEAHQGDVRVYDHSKYGAGVEILLPNIESDDPERRKRVVEDYIKDSLVKGIPSRKDLAA